MADSKEKLCAPTPKVQVVQSINIVFPSVDEQGGRFIIDFTIPRKTSFQVNVLRRSHSWPRIDPHKIPAKGASKRTLSWPRINRRRIPGRMNSEFKLPRSVTVLENAQGSKVFLVGTNHVRKQSEVDVAKTIREVQPDSVIIERCLFRISDLVFDEEATKKFLVEYRSKNYSTFLAKHGFLNGFLFFLEQDNEFRRYQKLGVLFGGEFRRAFQEAKKIPGCIVRLGDRSIYVTQKRAYAALSLKQKLLYGRSLYRDKRSIRRAQALQLLELGNASKPNAQDRIFELPEYKRVMVHERDLILTYALQQSAETVSSNPRYVVGVVGLGHVRGIKENWDKVTKDDIVTLFGVPGTPILHLVIIFACGLVIFVCLLLIGKAVNGSIQSAGNVDNSTNSTLL